MLKKEESIGELVKKARKEKKISARKLATLVGVSHTEINNIESGIRYKPSILVLKGFEKYLDIPFNKSAKLAGYSKETIEYGDDQIIVSYEMYDKKLNLLHINPGAAGKYGYHTIRTLIRFTIDKGNFSQLEVIELSN